MRRKLQRRYPDLGSYNTTHRAIATSEFLHDFVIDVGIVKRLDPPDESIGVRRSEGGAAMYSRLEENDIELEELAQGRRPSRQGEDATGYGAAERTLHDTPITIDGQLPRLHTGADSQPDLQSA